MKKKKKYQNSSKSVRKIIETKSIRIHTQIQKIIETKSIRIHTQVQKIIETKSIRGISYDFDQKNYMFWRLVNSFKMMK
jgi:hypothetical protein